MPARHPGCLLWATQDFARAIGFVLLALGAALLLGVKSRATLVLMGLTYLGLSFGLMAVQESEAWPGSRFTS